MSNKSELFTQAAEKTSVDYELQRKLKFNINKYAQTVEKGIKQFADLEQARQRAKNIKWKALESLDKYLIEFETNFTRRGGKVLWAETAEEALKEIENIVKRTKAK